MTSNTNLPPLDRSTVDRLRGEAAAGCAAAASAYSLARIADQLDRAEATAADLRAETAPLLAALRSMRPFRKAGV